MSPSLCAASGSTAHPLFRLNEDDEHAPTHSRDQRARNGSVGRRAQRCLGPARRSTSDKRFTRPLI